MNDAPHSHVEPQPEPRRGPQPAGRGRRALLWVLAFLLMSCAAIWQRSTGPTYPMKGKLTVAGEEIRYKLPRSEETIRPARVGLPLPQADTVGTLRYRRYPTTDPFTAVEMQREPVPGGNELAAELPAQPAAGKLEYEVILRTSDGERRIPADQDDGIVIRFKDPVPTAVLLPHVLLMFLSMLIGMRAALAALFVPGQIRPLAWITLVGLTLGGLVMGPLVQKYAFGAYWTGFPFGYDLTDNKTLIMWLGWLLACLILGTRGRPEGAAPKALARGAVVLAAVVMVGVYLIPHSLRGSQLDYSKVDQGVDPARAVETGR